MIHVLAIITAKPGQRDAVLERFRAVVPTVLAERGCIEYGPAVDAEGAGTGSKLGPDSFAVVEKWEDLAALGAHAAAPHMKAYGAQVQDLLADRTIYVLSPA